MFFQEPDRSDAVSIRESDSYSITTRRTPGTQRRIGQMANSPAADTVSIQIFNEDAEHYYYQ